MFITESTVDVEVATRMLLDMLNDARSLLQYSWVNDNYTLTLLFNNSNAMYMKNNRTYITSRMIKHLHKTNLLHLQRFKLTRFYRTPNNKFS